MAESSEELPNNSEELPNNSQELPDKSEKSEELPVKRKRGRPKGSLDSAPRKRRIVEEPPEPAKPPEPVAAPEPVVAPEPVLVSKPAPAPAKVRVQRATPAPVPAPLPAEPPSPRTLLRQAGETIYQLQSQRDAARRDFWAQQLDKTLR